MACKIADNFALAQLRADLGLKLGCHSLREHCALALERRSGDQTMGIPGAALGYCQALFNRVGPAIEHTSAVAEHLATAGMPWSKSHEMYYGYREDETIGDFICGGIRPLLAGGRMPILITTLQPHRDFDEISRIVETDNKVFPGETALLRIVLNSHSDIQYAKSIMLNILSRSEDKKQMPKWWPLLQGNLDKSGWKTLRLEMGVAWKYVNIAVNPFTPISIVDEIFDQITVAQVAIGRSEDIKDNGNITLSSAMPMTKLLNKLDYNLFEYLAPLSELAVSPTLIILGPSLPNWSAGYNIKRLMSLRPILLESTRVLWKDLDDAAHAEVWKQAA